MIVLVVLALIVRSGYYVVSARGRSGGGPPAEGLSAARAAVAAPVYAGQPGYGSHLDRDNDGVACE